MLLQFDETHEDDINKLLSFAISDNLKLSLVDRREGDYLLPGKPFTGEQITEVINNS